MRVRLPPSALEYNIQMISEGQPYPCLELLRRSVEIFDSHSIPYFVVGSIAIGSLIGKEFYVHSDGTSKDLDVLTPSPEEAANALKNEDLLKRAPHERKVDLRINDYVNIQNADGPRLQYKSVKIPVAAELFQSVETQAHGIHFVTLPAETLFHFYLITNSLRKEDWSNALALGRWIKRNNQGQVPDLSEEKYEGFHEYSRLKQERYPLETWMAKMDRRRNVEEKSSLISVFKSRFPWTQPVLSK